MLKKYSALLLLLLLVAATYSQVINHELLNYDDDVFVTANQYVKQGFTSRSLIWAFQADLLFDSASADYWQPMTIVSRLFDVQCFGLSPAAHHLMNLFYHVLNVLLVFILFYEWTGSLLLAWVIASLFGLHPLQVQTVSWVTARKDLLSALFSLSALIVYLKIKQPSILKTTLICFFLALGVMSKPSAAAIPLLMLLMDIVRKRNGFHLWKEKIPYFILSVGAFGILWGSKSGVTIDVPKEIQFYNIAFNCREYITKFLFPHNLSIYSRIPDSEFSFLKSILTYAVLTVISVWCFRNRKKHSHLFFGWFWFMMTITPSITLTRADRFMYFPMIGLSLGIVQIGSEWFRKTKRQFILFCIWTAIAVTLSFLSCRQTSYWKNNFTLFARALKLDDKNSRAHNNLASAYSQNGQDEEAISHYTSALAINPTFSQAHHNLAVILARKENLHVAEFHYLRAIETNPGFALAYANLGHLYMEVKDYPKAIEAYKKSLAIETDPEIVYKALGNALAAVDDLEGSCAQYAKALQINPNFVEAHHDWGFVLAKQARYPEAKEHFYQALRIDPDYGDVHNKLGVVLATEGDNIGAVYHLKEALRLNPRDKNAAHNLNLVLKENDAKGIVYEN